MMVNNMFGIEKQRLIENLERIRNVKCCAYINSEHFCDCKYGKSGDEVGLFGDENFNGCPELRMVIKLLKVMDYETFNNLCNSADIII